MYSVHMSAYGNSDEIREGQTSMLFNDMKEERQKGNYVICGGDFNHNLKLDENDNAEHEGWAYPFPRSKMPKELALQWTNCQKTNTIALHHPTEIQIWNTSKERLSHVY